MYSHICYWLVVVPVTYWLALSVVDMHFNNFCVLWTVKANEQKKQKTKIYNKETGEFHNHSRFIN